MLAQRSSGSYTAKSAMQKQDQRMRKGDLAPSADRLLTDRSSYIAYLESQLERVSAACLTVHSYDARLEEAVAAVRRLEEKILGVARLASTAQQYAEQQGAAQGAAQAELARRLRGLEARLDELERPGRAAEWEERLRSVSARLEAQVQLTEAGGQQRLADATRELRAGLEGACHESHARLEGQLEDAAGRLGDLERRLRAVDERAQRADRGAALQEMAARLGGLEDSVAHLAHAEGGTRQGLAALQAAVGQVKAAIVALELRPEGWEGGAGAASGVQWLQRARGALQREAADIQNQHGALAADMHAAAAAAAASAAESSPRRALAAQVLGALRTDMDREVAREVQALKQADEVLASVGATLGGQTGRDQPPKQRAALRQAPGSESHSAQDGGEHGSGTWAIAAMHPAAATVEPAVGTGPAAYPTAPTSQQAVAAASEGALAKLQQLAGGEKQLEHAAALASMLSSGGGSGGDSGLRATLGQMQHMLRSVCQVLQQDAPQTQPSAGGAVLPPATADCASRQAASTAAQSPERPQASGAKGSWSGAAGGLEGQGPLHVRAERSGGRTRDVARESVLGKAALAQRQERLQALYRELQQHG